MTRGACGGRGRIEQAKGGVDRSREKAKDAEGTSNEPQPSQAAGVDPIQPTTKGEGLTGGRPDGTEGGGAVAKRFPGRGLGYDCRVRSGVGLRGGQRLPPSLRGVEGTGTTASPYSGRGREGRHDCQSLCGSEPKSETRPSIPFSGCGREVVVVRTADLYPGWCGGHDRENILVVRAHGGSTTAVGVEGYGGQPLCGGSRMQARPSVPSSVGKARLRTGTRLVAPLSRRGREEGATAKTSLVGAQGGSTTAEPGQA